MATIDKQIIGKIPLNEDEAVFVESQFIDGRFCCVGLYVRPVNDPNKRRGAMILSVQTWQEVIRLLAPSLGMTGRDFAKQGESPKPSDARELAQAISRVYVAGRPFHKTGRNGLYRRRGELPDKLKRMGRDKLERLAGDLLVSSTIAQDENGTLYVPDRS
jgi:hypothetical protein